MRTYEKTHPWLKFQLDMRQAKPDLVVVLGECQSKCEDIIGVPLPPEVAKRLYRVFLAKGSLALTAIGGNTLTEAEVSQHLEGKLTLPPSRQYLAREIDNTVAAGEKICKEIQNVKSLQVTPATVMDLNQIVLNQLNFSDNVVPGQVRTFQRGSGSYRGAPFEDCPHLLQRLCEWLNRETFNPPPGLTVVYAIIKAVMAHLYLAWILPFGDGNGRTARLVEFQFLVAGGVPPPAAHLLSYHYLKTRSEYFRQLEQAGRVGGDELSFLSYAVQGFRDGLRSLLRGIQKEQRDMIWRNYVQERFRDKPGSTDARRRRLALDLSLSPQPVAMSQLAEISPWTAKTYATRTGKTLVRDVNFLIEMGLVKKDRNGIRARKEIIEAFPPIAADSETGAVGSENGGADDGEKKNN